MVPRIGALLVVSGLVIAACAPSTPPASTTAPPAPTIAARAAPTAVPAAQPTAARAATSVAEPAAAPTAAGQAAQPLRVAITRDESTLTPYSYVTGYPGWNMLHLVYDALLFLDADNQPVPGLASAFSASNNAQTWTLTLRDGVKWHDGMPLTPEDVKFSFDYMAQHTHSRWTTAARNVERIDVQGSTLAFQLQQPDPGFALQPLADMPIFPRHLWENVTEPKTFDRAVGSGPYRLVEYQPDQFYRLQANPDYFLGRPRVDELVLPIVKEPSAMFTALKTGQLDVTTRSLPPESVGEFEGQPGFNVVKGPGFTSTLLQFNTERAPFDRPEVRRAIDYAIDRQALVDTLLLGYGTSGSPGYLHPSLPLHDPSVNPVFDPAQAGRLLDELGFRDSDGDGVREADGRDMEHDLLVYSSQPVRIRTAEMVAGMLGEVGIQLNVKALDPQTVDSLVWKDFDVSQPRDYDLSIWGWSAPNMVRPDPLGRLVHSDPSRGSLNIGGYRSQEADQLVEQLAGTTDSEQRTQLIRQLEALIAREVPFVTLYYEDLLYAYRSQAYDGWAFQKGQGIFQKASFLSR